MSLQELKIVINDIIDDYNLDIWSLVAIIAFGVYTFLLAPLMYVHTTDAVIDGHIINVTSRASGQIIHSYVMKDQEVRKGDILMEIDPKNKKQDKFLFPLLDSQLVLAMKVAKLDYELAALGGM